MITNKDRLGENLVRLGNEFTCPAAVFIRDHKVLFGFRNYTPDKWKKISVWTCPGGRCDKGETVEQTLRREVAEEIGISEFEFLDYLGDVAGAKEGDTVPIFLCDTNRSPKLMEPNKFSEWRWFSLEEFPETFINEDVKRAILPLLALR